MLFMESPVPKSWTCAANWRVQRISSMEGLSTGSFDRHLTHISIIVFNDSSEHCLCTTGSTMLLRPVSSVVRLTLNCKMWERKHILSFGHNRNGNHMLKLMVGLSSDFGDLSPALFFERFLWVIWFQREKHVLSIQEHKLTRSLRAPTSW